MDRRPKIGLVTPSSRLFDEQMPASFRTGLEQRADHYRAELERDFNVAHWGLISDSGDARRANDHLKKSDIDAAVLAAPMAAPPELAEIATSGLRVPIIIWNTAATNRLKADLDQVAAHEDTALLGALMYANTVVRDGARPIVVSADPGDSAQVRRVTGTIRAATAAVALRHATVIRIGDPIEGYSDVRVSEAESAMLGVTERRVSIEELSKQFTSAGDAGADEIRALTSDMGWTGESDRHSRQLAAALRQLVETHQADCGTVNCHGPWFRSSPDIGIVGCLGVSLCTAAGVPMTCTGDLPTALALKLARDIAGASLYCEVFAYEADTGLALLSNGGEGDAGLASSPPNLAPTKHYPGLRGSGTAVSFSIADGPATLLSLTPTDKNWRLVCATGEIVDSRYPEFGAPNVMFRFDTEGADVIDRWLTAGPVHHHALTPGRISDLLAVASQVLGAEYVEV
jgi:L-arabinose isomerase